ncbi:hypothetical protein F4777DRAFT_133117 [Nemania sp. FL0916]|nr:hypothetical protein F4777DRAFT_133117 [Nemania sp. FL0916]
MATASSQPPANSANAPAAGAVRPSAAAGPPLSESPTVVAPSFSAPGVAANGVANGPLIPMGPHPEDSPGAEMRIYPRDGRVRNPVPSKLKNVNAQMKGNFGVMHMDVASHRASEGRDAAAKRTSESTALQAKMAQTDVYVSHQRRANYPRPPGLKQYNPPKISKKPEESAGDPGPPRPLTVAETKAEQARLLTLLRTLPHHTVVDQICKGLAFFGGVPDAPPPAEGKFPESEQANGSGSLFVGWIAEIFPDLDNPRPRHVDNSAAQAIRQKRPRGRPKGSKATKARSDKGLKKGSQKTGRGPDDHMHDPHDDSWVDVEDSVLEINESGDLVEAVTSLRDAPGTPTGPDGSGATPATGSAAGFRSINDTSLAPGSSAKKRGRPKGSKNRPKDKPALQSVPPPKVTPVPVPIPMLDSQPKTKSSTTKAKSTKNRPKPTTETVGDMAAANIPNQQRADPNVTTDHPPIQAPTTALEFPDRFAAPAPAPAVNGAITHDHEGRPPAQSKTPTLPSPASQVKASTVTAKKRKRPTGNTITQSESTAPPVGASSGSQHIQQNAISGTTSAQLQHQASQAIRQSTPTHAAVPPPKRARKSQESTSTVTARRQTPNSLSQKATAPSVPVVTESTHQSNPGDAVTQNHRPAEGLEAHYAAMQSHTDQMQTYTNTRPQHKQQPHSTSSIGPTVSPAPAAAPAPTGGLDAHYEHFTALQNLSDSARQTSTGRQKQQPPPQTASPIPTQPSKLPQMSSSLTSQQPRSSQSYYSQNQGLGSSYSTQQQSSYSATQRPQQHMAGASPNTGLVQHVTNSPQFSTQSNSPLMQPDNNYRGSPSLIHNNTAFATRRTPTASPLDNNTYRSSNTTNHAVTNHSPHFGARQTPATATGHNTSHSGLSSSSFPTFSDPSLFDMSLDSSGGHSNMGIGGNSYALNSGAVSQQQRSSSSNTGSLYSSSGMNNTYLGSTSMGRTSQQNRWGS